MDRMFILLFPSKSNFYLKYFHPLEPAKLEILWKCDEIKQNSDKFDERRASKLLENNYNENIAVKQEY